MRTRPRPNPTPRSAANVALLTGVWFDVADVDGQSVWRRFAPSSLRLAGAVLEAAQASLPPERIRQLHAKPAQRVEELIHRGQSERVFRADLPPTWLVSVLYHILKGAAADVSSGRLDPSDGRNSSSQQCSPPTQTPMNPSHP
jgi:TetR/AcrR family transcriptional repressor of mexCD-oprJ operon